MIPGSAYSAHEALVAPGRSKPQLWRLPLGLGLIAAVSYLLNTIVFSLLLSVTPDSWLTGLAQGATPTAMLLLLGSFGFLTLGADLAARVLQGRTLLSLLGPPSLLVQQFLRVSFGLTILAAVLLILPPYDFGAPLRANLGFGLWFSLLPLSLLAVLIQVSAEEVVFRGYMQQALAARFKSAAIWMLVPSALFGLSHYMPVEAGDNAWLICLWAMGFGLLMADLTARAGSLGPAIAVHFFNNIIALLIFASPSSLYGLALYLLPYDLADAAQLRPWLLVDGAMMLTFWLVARLAIRR